MIVYAPRALRDLEAIEDYLQAHHPSIPRYVFGTVKTKIESLAVFPGIGTELSAAGLRRMPIVRYPYVVFYRPDRFDIIILHIRH
jgi:plasmid stabilization system protein ParE